MQASAMQKGARNEALCLIATVSGTESTRTGFKAVLPDQRSSVAAGVAK